MKEVPLSRGRVALVDDEDYELLKHHNWQTLISSPRLSYAVCTVRDPDTRKRSTVYMHRLLTVAGPDEVVDHINHDGLDNRRANLRICSRKQNQRNARARKGTRSKWKGVHWCQGKWAAQIMVNGTRYHLGRFDHDADAAMAYNEAALAHFGEFASLNESEENSA